MIQVRRIPEELACPELTSIRENELKRVRKALETQRLTASLLGTEYRAAKRALYDMQHRKCCYCERFQDLVYEHVEHYRPKAEVHRPTGPEAGYWWLTWTWENLLFSCGRCNPDKHTSFPLAPGSIPLAPEQPPPGNEVPELLDPSAENPRPHIRFCSIGDTWMPFPRDGSTRGNATLTALKLYHPRLDERRGGLSTEWRKHVRSLQPAIARVRAALSSQSMQVIRAVWQVDVEPHLFVNQEYVALSLDVFEEAFSSEVLAQWGLVLAPIDLHLENR